MPTTTMGETTIAGTTTTAGRTTTAPDGCSCSHSGGDGRLVGLPTGESCRVEVTSNNRDGTILQGITNSAERRTLYETGFDIRPPFNVSPSQAVLVIRS